MLLGFLAGDGSVQVRKEGKYFHYQLDFFPDNEIIMDTYINLINSLYNKNPSIRFRDGVFQVRLTSKAIVLDILSHASFGLKSWNVPFKLLSNESRVRFWLKGFFSAEAYVGEKTIKVQTVNKKGMRQVSELLNTLKIKHTSHMYVPRRKNHSKVYILMINKKESRLRYYHNVGFFHSEKQEKLKEALSL